MIDITVLYIKDYMPSGLLVNYYFGDQHEAPPTNVPYDPAYPSVTRTESRTNLILWKKYRNLIPVLRK